MARVQKVLLRKGVYEAPQGTFRATPARLRHFVKQHEAMNAVGIRVPVAWGHQPEALPGDQDDRSRKQYYLSRYNAGYLDSLTIKPDGTLSFGADLPGCEVENDLLVAWERHPDGVERKTAVGEVSAAIRDWRDGKGRLWKDSIVHVAITPLPVVAGMSGFASAGATLSNSDQTEKTFFLSLGSFRCELGDDMDTDKPADEVTEPVVPPVEPVAPVKPPAADPQFGEAMAILMKMGLPLHGNTTPETLINNIVIAGHAMLNGKGADKKSDDEKPLDEEDANPPAYQEESKPVMMSLATATDPAVRTLIREKQEKAKARALRDIDHLVNHNAMPPTDAARLRGAVDGYELSLTPDGATVEQPVDVELSIWRKVWKSSPAAAVARAKSGTRVTRPDEQVNGDEREMTEAASEMAARVSRTTSK